MGLIYCPDCSNEVSEKAKSCPRCGAPISSSTGGCAEEAGDGLGCIVLFIIVFVLIKACG
ncbi:zinc-ribbon domain-containing protein [Crocinitomicaceae bacterium]|nr:zinc-ribbon domain-containing protein [Crocinitomicaceae bacterium]